MRIDAVCIRQIARRVNAIFHIRDAHARSAHAGNRDQTYYRVIHIHDGKAMTSNTDTSVQYRRCGTGWLRAR